MRFSLWPLLCVACASYPEMQHYVPEANAPEHWENPYFSNPETDYLYKADLELGDHRLGGLFIVKKISKEKHRVVLTGETGQKILDISIEVSGTTVNYVLPELNRKPIVRMLSDDLMALVTEHHRVKNAYIWDGFRVYNSNFAKEKGYAYFKEDKLDKIALVRGTREKTSFIFSDIEAGFAKNIRILHTNQPINISLTALPNRVSP